MAVKTTLFAQKMDSSQRGTAQLEPTRSAAANFSFSIRYSRGIAYRGVLSRHLASGKIDPFHRYYWNNQVHLGFQVPVLSRFYVKPSTSYIWAYFGRTGTLFRPNEGHFIAGANKWEFTGYSFSLSVGGFVTRDSPVYIEAGFGYYLWCGTDHETKAYTFETVLIENQGNGIYGILSGGISIPVIYEFDLDINISKIWSSGRQERFSSDQVEQLTPVVFHQTGIYFGLGVKYSF